MTDTLAAPRPAAPAAEIATPPPGAAEKPGRLLALDVFRGITIAGMLLVNNPGSWDHVYPPLDHAEWNGWTPTGSPTRSARAGGHSRHRCGPPGPGLDGHPLGSGRIGALGQVACSSGA